MSVECRPVMTSLQFISDLQIVDMWTMNMFDL